MPDKVVEQHEPGLNCPVCRVALVMSERQNIEIDYCPKCRGVWLDRGELDKIIERSLTSAQPDQPPPAAYAPQPARTPPAAERPYSGGESYGHGSKHGGSKHGGSGHGNSDYGQSGKRRKSWLGELFD